MLSNESNKNKSLKMLKTTNPYKKTPTHEIYTLKIVDLV